MVSIIRNHLKELSTTHNSRSSFGVLSLVIFSLMLSAILSGPWVSLCVMEALPLLSRLNCSLRKDICCCRLSLEEGVHRSLDFPWHNSMSYRVVRRTTVLQAATRFSASCVLSAAVSLHDGLLHHCRLRKIPLRHPQRLAVGRGGRVAVVK